MKIDDYVLYKNIPSIDLHGMNRFQALVELREFINNSITLKYRFIKVIHGFGAGILEQTVKSELKINKNVIDYRIDLYNGGTTIILLKEHHK